MLKPTKDTIRTEPQTKSKSQSGPVNLAATIIAGPCSVNQDTTAEIYQLAELKAGDQAAIAGTRVVGLKSRTILNPSGQGMGMDFDAYVHNEQVLLKGGSIKDFQMMPSVELAKQIHRETGMLIASEIVSPVIQLPAYSQKFPSGGFLPWCPSVQQLGWPMWHVAHYAKKNNWSIGIKNGKWPGNSLEKVWAGLASYTSDIGGDVILIHRGVDTTNKGDFRNMPAHEIAQKTKRQTGAKLFFDPSHIYGPRLRDKIVSGTIEAMQLKIDDQEFLYDGILIEVGTSLTDTEQHITIKELQQLVDQLAEFRQLVSP